MHPEIQRRLVPYKEAVVPANSFVTLLPSLHWLAPLLHKSPDVSPLVHLLASAPPLLGSQDAAKARPQFLPVRCVPLAVSPAGQYDPDILWHHQADSGPHLQSDTAALPLLGPGQSQLAVLYLRRDEAQNVPPSD